MKKLILAVVLLSSFAFSKAQKWDGDYTGINKRLNAKYSLSIIENKKAASSKYSFELMVFDADVDTANFSTQSVGFISGNCRIKGSILEMWATHTENVDAGVIARNKCLMRITYNNGKLFTDVGQLDGKATSGQWINLFKPNNLH